MSRLARESIDQSGSPIPVVGQGTTDVLVVEAAFDYCYISIGAVPAPQTAATRFRIPAGVVEYFRVIPGVDAIGARCGSTSDSTAVVGDHTTVVRILYDEVAGQVCVMEGLK